MYLKKVRMENFKSFGKKMEIPFKEGYTNITGPNGSGKSNIGDAILFVLGPKSSKEIRAGRLTDLIFNGGKEGKPADTCKVSLIFENEDRAIPLDSDQVTFTRKIKRSDNQQGYNSYFYINGRSSKLQEFQRLLAHARISADGYNIVQQGDISKIVEMSDLERRRILDDISGISEYDSEIEEAEEKKDHVNEDLERINILLDEIKTQVDELEDDRTKALKYQELSDRVSDAKKMKAWKMIKNTENNIASIQDDIEETKQKIEDKKEKKEEKKERVQELLDEISDLKEELKVQGGGKSKELQSKINDLRLKVGRSEDRKEDAEYTIEQNKKRKELVIEDLQKKREELSDVKSRLRKIEDEKEEKKDELKDVKREIEEIREKQSESDERITDLRKEGLKIKKKIDEKNDSLSEKTVELDRKEDNVDRLVEKISELEEEIEGLQFEKKEAKWDLKEIKKDNKQHDERLKELKEKFHENKKKEKSLRKDKSDLEDRVDRLTRKYNQLKAEEEAAKSVKKGYTRAVSKILEARDTGDLSGIHGTIAELADVEEQYETALQVAAGGRMQSIVVEDDAVASEAIKLLKKNKSGRATFLPLNKMRSGRPRGKALRVVKEDKAVDFALELVDYDEKYENVFWYVFGDTVVMEDIDSARQHMGGVRMVTLDGEQIERSGAMKGGTLRKNMMSFNAPDRGKLDRVSKELQMTRDNLERVTDQLKEVEEKIQDIQDEMQELQNEGNPQEQTELEARVDRLDKKIQNKKSTLEEKREEKSKLEDTVDQLNNSVQYIQNEIEQLKDKRREISEKIKKISPEELSSKLTKLKDKEVEVDKNINKLDSELETKKNEREMINNEIDDLEEEKEKLKEENKQKESQIKKLKSKIDEKQEKLDELMEEQDSMDEELEELRNDLDEKKDERLELKHEIDSIDTEIESKKKYIISQKQKLKNERENLEELKEELGDEVDYSDEEIPPMKEIKHTIRRCENKMDDLQPVNMRALEDYKKKKERMEKLKEEYTELENRREELNKLIEEMDVKKREGLMKVKKEIDKNFQKVYKDLSDGGEAHLELEDEEEPFEGGLIIKARPPGKKVHRIDALSGGEKSLVSMAFIFSIQMYDPSPFYLLDEIDQNLDGINAENVAEMISGNSESAQFIQISLRKVTLKKSDHIIGVTIHENGISDVIMKVNIGDGKERDIPEFSEVSKLKTEVQ